MRRKIHGFSRIWPAAAFAALLAGCATLPPPVQLMDRAQAEIRAARSAGAATTAPEALAEAERRLAAAQQFSANGDNDKATDKAAEAEAAAATARARAGAAQLDREIRQQTDVNAGLKADLQRKLAAAAAAQQAVLATPASGSSTAAPATGNAPVTLPIIQLGQPVSPASTGNPPAPAGSSGSVPGVNP